MKVIGITGGIASGKTTVARMFAEYGLLHLDADALVHQLMHEDKDTIAAISTMFPESFETGQISRRVLSGIVTAQPLALPMLEAILHPRVRAAEERAIEKARADKMKGALLDIPLLFETGAEAMCDVVVAVHAPLEVVRARAFQRPGMTEEKWERLTHRQLDDKERCARADAVVSTAGDVEATRKEVAALAEQWGLA